MNRTIGAFAFGTALLIAGAASATPMVLTITITPNIAAPGTTVTQTFSDNGTNVIAVSPISFGGVTIQGEFARSTIGTTNQLTSVSSDVLNGNSTTSLIQVAISGQNFIGPDNLVALSASGTWQNSAGSIFNVNWYNDPANALGATTATDGRGNNVGTYTSPSATGLTSSFSFSPGVNPLAVPDLARFSMSEVFSYQLLASGELVSRGTTEIKTNAVPEPASLLVLGLALTGLGLARRSRQA